MIQGDFSVPRIRIQVISTQYYVAPGKYVKCVAKFQVRNSFSDRMGWALGELCDIHYTSNHSCTGMQKVNNSTSEIIVPRPTDGYEGIGYARLKANDVEDEALARKIAFKKAYRNFLRLYYGNYEKILVLLNKYLNVGMEQFNELVWRDIKTSADICDLVGKVFDEEVE